jgi:Ion channel
MILGLLLVAIALNDLFQSVIVPRAVGRRFRPSFYQARMLWRLWPHFAPVVRSGNVYPRENFLAVFGPFNLVLNLVTWSLLVLLGYGTIFFALRDQMHPNIHTLGEALYFAGTSFFTIGFGDYFGTSGLTRMFSLAAGACGFGIISITTAYVFAIFGAFQSREQFVVSISARAGVPPSGVGLLMIAADASIIKDLPSLMRSGEMWCASVMETHLAYPILGYFRSSHDEQSWVGTLGTLLDTATLLISTVRADVGEARILYTIGRHAARDLGVYFGLLDDNAPNDPGITRDEFHAACRQLEAAGLELHDPDAAWDNFARLRGTYAYYLNGLAAYFHIPPLRWIGEKTGLAT